MNRKLLKSILVPAVLLIAILTAVSCNRDTNNSPAGEDNYVKNVDVPVVPNGVLEADSVPDCITDCLMSLPTEELNDAETEHMQYMREEEYLARDVYIYLYDLYNIPVFNNISKAEQFHTSVIKVLLDKYDLEDPGEGHVEGVFQNETLQTVYNQLIATGDNSLEDALTVGATIEDLDIFDLEESLNDVDNEDITLVFNSLMKGSRNHMRAFTAHLTFHGITYEPQYISQEEYDEIVNSSWEIGNGICVSCSSSQQMNKNLDKN
jgi:hypothetical protein